MFGENPATTRIAATIRKSAAIVTGDLLTDGDGEERRARTHGAMYAVSWTDLSASPLSLITRAVPNATALGQHSARSGAAIDPPFRATWCLEATRGALDAAEPTVHRGVVRPERRWE
jgi:hypothetical protein